ncbi:zinc-binding dehydrogenase [Dyadobacter sp. CY347]|uniref:zinc-binding dehydrogenase n=1 Tax=Dyadobacter sp. CY347 TaxID=2909336 RepID=UPI0038D3685D
MANSQLYAQKIFQLNRSWQINGIRSVFPFEEMGEAHLQVETGKTKGKVVVSTNVG